MAHQDVTDTVSVQLIYFLDNNNASNILHVKYTGVIGITDLDALFTVFSTWLTTDWAPLAGTGWAATGAVITDLNSLAGRRKSYTFVAPIAGSNVSPAMPANVTLAVKEDIGRRGRGIAGRIFWVGLAESQVAGDQASDAIRSSILVAMGNLNTAIQDAPPFSGIAVPHLVVHGVRPPVATADLIDGFFITDPYIDTQKDRLPGHKRHKRPPVA